MNRKIVFLAAALLISSACLAGTPRRSPLSPYEYGKRVYIALQGGVMTTFSENVATYAANNQAWGRAALTGQLSIGYHITSAFSMRLSGSFNRPAGALEPYDGFYPYRYNAYHLFADVVWDFNSMAEHFVSFSPKVYVGLGGALTNNFTPVEHSYQTAASPNLVPGFRLGGILEFDGEAGFGWFIDAGFEFMTDWYDGLDPSGFPFDLSPKLSLGIVYHIPR